MLFAALTLCWRYPSAWGRWLLTMGPQPRTLVNEHARGMGIAYRTTRWYPIPKSRRWEVNERSDVNGARRGLHVQEHFSPTEQIHQGSLEAGEKAAQKTHHQVIQSTANKNTPNLSPNKAKLTEKINKSRDVRHTSRPVRRVITNSCLIFQWEKQDWLLMIMTSNTLRMHSQFLRCSISCPFIGWYR